MIAPFDFPRPYAPRRAEFGNFLEKITVHIKKERQPWREGIDRQASLDSLLDVGQPIIQRKRQFLDGRGAGFTDMIATNTDGIPLREMLGTVGDRVTYQAHRWARGKDPLLLGDVFFEDVILHCAAQLC